MRYASVVAVFLHTISGRCSECLAWTTTTARSIITQAPPRRRSNTSSRLLASHQHHHYHHESNSYSRRKWLEDVVATAGGAASVITAVGWSCNPEIAAALKIEPTASLCDPTVSVWERNGRIVYLLGTAHISSQSAELAGQLVRETHPDAVFVELDLKRVGGTSTMAKRMQENGNQITISSSDNGPETKPTRIILSPVLGAGQTPSSESSSSTAIATTAEPMADGIATPTSPPAVRGGGGSSSGGGGGFLQGLGAAVVGKGIRSLYSKLGSEGFNPGEEFVLAIKEGQKQGAAVVLGDQDVDVTLRRMTQAFQQTDFNKLLSPDSELEQSMREMMPSSSGTTNAEITNDDKSFSAGLTQYVETIKSKENIKRIMGLMKQEAPALYQVMVTERDAYMAMGLNTLDEFAVITAVMGLAHVEGVENNLQSQGWKQVPVRCPQLA